MKTKKQIINRLLLAITPTEKKIKDVTMAIWNRMNENEQDAFEKKREEEGKTSEYRVYYDDKANRMY